jgi:DNA-binding PadR family transcriptional regulator
LLLELLREPSWGYDLIKRLGEYGFRRAIREPAVVYKVLRSLEDAGSIESRWSTQESGPARRYYEITPQGREVLHDRAYYLNRYRERIDRLIRDYIAITNDDLTGDLARDDDASAQPLAAGGRGGA